MLYPTISCFQCPRVISLDGFYFGGQFARPLSNLVSGGMSKVCVVGRLGWGVDKMAPFLTMVYRCGGVGGVICVNM